MLQTILVIDRNSGKSYEMSNIIIKRSLETNDKIDPAAKIKPIYGVLGQLKIFGKSVLIYIEEADLVCFLDESSVFTIKKIGILHIDQKESLEMLDVQEKEFINHLSRFLQQCFFFSYTYDLTQHSQKKYIMLNSSYVQVSMSQIKQNTNRFWWNMHMLKPWIKDGISEQWHLKIILGYVGSFATTFKNNQTMHYYLISRKQQFRGGNIKNHLGIDEEGHVANHVETEQIITINHIKCSYVLLRGSLPLFYQKMHLSTDVDITKEFEIQKKAFQKHFTTLLNNYTKVACINLLGKTKSNDVKLSTLFEKLYYESKIDNVAYHQLDFAEICKDYNFLNLNVTIEKLSHVINYFEFFFYDPKLSKLKQQKGIFRINCFDCLTKSNIYMSKLALQVAQNMLTEMGINIESEFNSKNLLDESDSVQLENQHPFIVYFKQQWESNQDFVSKIYLPQNMPLKNVNNKRMSFNTMLNQEVKGIEKFNKKYDYLKILPVIGSNISTSSSLQNLKYFENILKDKEARFKKINQVEVYAVTWNINAHIPSNPNSQEFCSLFDLQGNPQPDLIAVAIQELVQLNAVNVVGNINQQQIELWRGLIEQTVNKMLGNYIMVANQDMVGCLLLVLVRKDLQNQVKNIEADAVKCGFGSKLGNKGGVIIRMKFYDSLICFINCHLPAGQKKSDARLAAIEDIHLKAFNQDKQTPTENRIENCDWVVFMGDTNFRINLPYFTAIEYIQKFKYAQSIQMKDMTEALLHTMKESDQLNLEKNKSPYLKKYQESSITFLPTYKFDIGTDRCDTSKKQRVPSWTDRVMFQSSQHPFKAIFYVNINGPSFQVSDHRPVSCYFLTSVSQVDETKKEDLFIELLNDVLDEEPNWSEKYYANHQLIDDSPKKKISRKQRDNVDFQIHMFNDEHKARGRAEVMLVKSIAGGQRKKIDLELLTHPFE